MLSESSPVLADGAMVFFLQIEPAAMPTAEATTSIWGQQIWREELTKEDAYPFTWREQASLWRDPYLYTFSLGCVPPTHSNDLAAGLAFCRYVWDFHIFNFGLCAQPGPSFPQPGIWQTVQDELYRYHFEVPAGWYKNPEATADRLDYYTHPVYQQPYPACFAPDDFMKLELIIGSPGEYAVGGQLPEIGEPAVEGWTAVAPISNRPAWIRYENSEEGVFTGTTSLLIRGTQFWYRLSLYCIPDWTADCDTVFTHLQNSFVIEP